METIAGVLVTQRKIEVVYGRRSVAILAKRIKERGRAT